MDNLIKLNEKLEELKQKRKNKDISIQEFCTALMDILGEMKNYLSEVNDEQVRKRIPLMLTLIQSQIKEVIGNK